MRTIGGGGLVDQKKLRGEVGQMEGWLRKARGLLGLTAVGGLLGALFGGAATGVIALLGGGGLSLELILVAAGAWGGIAAAATAGVGVFLAAGGPWESLSELSAGRAGLLGMIIGAAAQLLLISGIKVFVLGLAPTITLPVAASLAIGGVLGGSLGAGLVTVGKKAGAESLEEANQPLLDRAD